MRLFFGLLFIGLLSCPGFATARDWQWNQLTAITRCFEKNKLKVWCEDFTEEGSRERLEEINIAAMDFWGRKFTYSYGKAIDAKVCQEHFNEIRRLLRGVDQACVTGDDEIRLDTGEFYSRWRRFGTRRGEVVR